MPTTVPNGYPYPPGEVIPDVPYWLQQLAQAVDNLHSTVSVERGTLTTLTPWTPVGSGVSYARVGNLLTIVGRLSRPDEFSGSSSALLELPGTFVGAALSDGTAHQLVFGELRQFLIDYSSGSNRITLRRESSGPNVSASAALRFTIPVILS